MDLRIILATALIAVSIVGCNTRNQQSTYVRTEADSDARFLNLGGNSEFVGDEACFSCHEDEYLGYRRHGMAKTFHPMADSGRSEHFGKQTVVDERDGYRYTPIERDGSFFIRETLLDTDGDTLNVLEREIDYVIGSATVAHMYATEINGWFYELPLAWYSGGQTWNFAPGYDRANLRFDRKITNRCIVCHNDYPEVFEQTNGAFRSMPDGIGCERCHGPGALHVEERLESSIADSVLDPTIVNPVHLSLDLRLDVCQQCHLQTEVSLLQQEGTAFGYRPSRDLDDHFVMFDLLNSREVEQGDKLSSVNSHTERMKMSACFIESLDMPEPMECVTCHDPHASSIDLGPRISRAACMSCHVGIESRFEGRADTLILDHQRTDDCASCHMPATELSDAPHSKITDHFIRANPTDRVQPEKTTELSEEYASKVVGNITDDETAEYAAMARITYGRQQGKINLMRQGVAELDSIMSRRRVSEQAAFLHGHALLTLGQPEMAVRSLRQSVDARPKDVERLATLARALHESGRGTRLEIGKLYDKALTIQPKRADYRAEYGRFLEDGGNIEAAIREYRQAIADEPPNYTAHYNLGTALLNDGRLDSAAMVLERAVNLRPRSADAWSNLGIVQIQTGRTELGERSLSQAIELAPDHFDALLNLGTLYLRNDQSASAVTVLERAVRQDDRSIDALKRLALAYAGNGQMNLARDIARDVLILSPRDAFARQLLSVEN